MTLSQRESYGPIILRLLLDDTLEDCDRQNMVWGELLDVAAQNGVLIRVVDQLQAIGVEQRHFFCAAVAETRASNQKKLAFVARIAERCLEGNVDFIFAKALQNHPDMGNDIDLYVAPHSTAVDAVILKGLQATPVQRNLRNLIDGTATYRLTGCESLLDIHHGRIGMMGEHRLYISQIIKNGSYLTRAGGEFLLPSPEDQLVLQALNTVAHRSYLPLSDVVTTVTLVRGKTLQWNYILDTAKNLNIFHGLGCYLNFVEHIHLEACKENLLPESLRTSLISKNPGRIEFKDGFYRFRRLVVGSRDYTNKFCSALSSQNWSVASRLTLLPVLALITIVRKLRTS